MLADFLQVLTGIWRTKLLSSNKGFVILSYLFYLYLKDTEGCDFVCYLGWEKHAVNYLLFGRRWARLSRIDGKPAISQKLDPAKISCPHAPR